ERDAKAFVDATADVGGSLSFSASREALWVSAEFLAVDSGLMLDLISVALLRPKLPQDEFVRLRARAIDSIAAAKDSGGRGLIGAYAQAWIFRDHPYGRPVEGDERSLAAIGPEDIAAYFRDHVGADRAIVSIVGDIDPAAMRRQIERSFSNWPRAQGELPQVPVALRENATRVLLVDKPGSAQSYFSIG